MSFLLPVWPPTHSVLGNDLELQRHLPLCPECWDGRHLPSCLFYVVLERDSRASSCILGKILSTGLHPWHQPLGFDRNENDFYPHPRKRKSGGFGHYRRTGKTNETPSRIYWPPFHGIDNVTDLVNIHRVLW